MLAIVVALLLAACSLSMPSREGKPILTHEFECGVKSEGYDTDNNEANGAEVFYLSYQGKTFGMAEFESGEEGKFKHLLVELGSGDTVKMSLEEVKALDLTPCTLLGYSLTH